MNFLQSKLMIIPVTIVVALLAWWGLTAAPANDSLIGAQNIQTGEERQLAEVLGSISKVTLEGSVFQNSLFSNLQDFSTTIVQEPSGRNDPFAPVAGEATAPVQTKQDAIFNKNRPTIPRSQQVPHSQPL